MTHKQLQREFQYRVAMSLAKELMKNGVISDEEYRTIDSQMIKCFQPVLSGLYPKLS